MAESVITSTIDEILEILPRVPRYTVDKQIRRVWQAFCRRAMIWQKDVAFARTAGQHHYTVSVKENATVHKVDALFFRTADQVSSDEAGQPLSKRIYRVTVNRKNQLEVILSVKPSDTLDNGYLIRLVLAPERDAEIQDEILFAEYQTGIIGGVISDLARRPGRPWTDYSLANEYRTEYFRAISRALSIRAKGLTHSHGVLTSS